MDSLDNGPDQGLFENDADKNNIEGGPVKGLGSAGRGQRVGPGGGLPVPLKGNISTPWFRMQTGNNDVGLSRLFPIVTAVDKGNVDSVTVTSTLEEIPTRMRQAVRTATNSICEIRY